MKRYTANRQINGTQVAKIVDAKLSGFLACRPDLMNHPHPGFEWGYGGSGPAQLALAILADHLGDDERALNLHQQFKWSVISELAHDAWTITAEQIDQFLASYAAGEVA